MQRCCRLSAEVLDRQAREAGVTRPSMKLVDNHLSLQVLDISSMKNCCILQEAQIVKRMSFTTGWNWIDY